MKLKDLIEQYGEYEIKEFNFEEAFHKLDNDDDILGIGIEVLKKKPKPKTVWELENGNECYYIDVFGDIEDTGGYLSPLSEAIESGNVFLTREEAEKEVERRKVETLLIKHGGRRWFKKNMYNYFIRADDEHPFWIDELKDNANQGTIYFSMFEDVEKAISEIGEERIKKALFEVR